MVSNENPETGILIGKLLIKEGLVTTEQVQEALRLQRDQGGKTFEILIRLGHLDKDGLHGALSRQPGVASIELSRVQVDPALTELIPKELALKQLVLPIDKLGKLLTVAMACPLDKETIAEIERLTGLKVKGMLCRYDDIATAVDKHYKEREARGAAGMHTFRFPPQAGTPAVSNLGEKLQNLRALALSESVARSFEESLKGGDLRGAVQRAGQDPGLAAYLLAVANSGAYGMPGEVDSLGLAAAALGVEGMRGLLAEIRKEAPVGVVGLESVYATAERAGLIAAMLAKKTGKADRSVAYTAGLLRRLGVVALATLAPKEYAKIDFSASESARLEQERNLMGMSHLEAGGRLAARWHLPNVLCHAAGSTIEDPEAAEPAVTIACAAALLAERGAAQGAAALDDMQPLLGKLGLTPEAAVKETAKLLA
jgi:HD-like signal output (HDOD) protein